MRIPWVRGFLFGFLLGGLSLLYPHLLSAATNSATGGIGGIDNGTLSGGDGTGTAQITINPVDLALVKQARDLAGIVLPDGASVASGQEIYFVIYVDNATLYQAGNIQIIDLLNESEFTYIPGSLEVTSVPSGSTDAQIWAGTWGPISDDVGSPDDIASITDSNATPGKDNLTIGAVGGQANQKLDIPGTTISAIRFRVRVN